MFVGIGRVTLRISGSRSLKDRRRVVSSYKDRLRARLSVSVAEVGELDQHQLATVGIALVAREAGEAAELLDRAIAAAHQLPGTLVLEATRRVLPWQPGWSGAPSDPLHGFGGGDRGDAWDGGESADYDEDEDLGR